MRTHITILGWLQVALGLFDLLIALIAFGVLAGLGMLGGLSGEPISFIVGGVVGTVVGGFVALTALPNILAGVGLLAHRNWARVLALILGALNLLKFPYGTVLGVYTFWVLLNDRAKLVFR